MRIILVLISCFIFQGNCFSQDLIAKDYLFKMLAAISNVKTASYDLFLHERTTDKFRESEFQVKLNVKPFKLYALSIHPHEGAEALLVDGMNDQKALINPNSFPYLNLNIQVGSSLLRKNHHYTFFEVGFTYIEKILRGYINRDGDKFFNSLHFSDNIEFAGVHYFMLEMDYPSYALVDYTVQAGEDISSIASKLLVNDHKILTANPEVSYYDDVKPGQVIKVPNAFARKIVLYIDKITLLPLVQNVYDENGLYGRYEIRNFILNPVFAPDEFTPTFNGYHF